MRLKLIYTFSFLTLLIFGCDFAQGQIQFENTYQNNGEVSGESIQITPDSGFVITGFTNPTGSFFGQEVLINENRQKWRSCIFYIFWRSW